MMNSLSSSFELVQSHNFEYEPQELATTKSKDGQGLKLSRNATNASELSKILTGIRDDHELDNEELSSYKDRFPEQRLAEQLEISSKSTDSKDKSEDAAEDPEEDHPVDGIFAFWQAFLVMLQILSTWGVNSAFGVFLNYYLDSNSFPGTSMYTYALMGGVIVFLAQFLAPVSVLLVKLFGQTTVLAVGIVLQTGGYIIASICTEFWQVFICEGIMIGLSFALLFIPGTFIMPTWFDKRKSAAMGIAVAGSGLGGVIFSLAVDKVIQDTGDQKWGLRMVGLITFAISSFATIFMRPRNKRKIKQPPFSWDLFVIHLKTIFDYTEFKDYPFVLISIWFGIVVMAYVIILYSFANYATGIGLSGSQGSNLLAILNAAQVVGRPLIGQIGDACGRYNTASIFCAYVGILVFAFWMNATTYEELIALAVIMGLGVGVGSTMAQSLALDLLELIGKPQKLPAVWSTLNIVVGLFSLPAEVIALKLKTTGQANNFAHAQIYAGCCLFTGLILLLVIREWSVRHVLAERRQKAIHELSLGQDSALDEHLGTEKGLDAECNSVHQARIDRYNKLLCNSPTMYFVRMLYPIRV